MRANGWRGNTPPAQGPDHGPGSGDGPGPGPGRPELQGRRARAAAGRGLHLRSLVAGDLAYVAFVTAFAGTIRGWEASTGKETPFVQRAIR